MEEENEFLGQLLMDLSLTDLCDKQLQKYKGNPEFISDELSRGFKRLQEQGEVSIWVVSVRESCSTASGF